MKNIMEIAMSIAKDAHKEQYDMGGVPYIEHPIAVSSLCKTREGKITGLLHDVVEDSDYTLDDLRGKGIPENIVEAVGLLTKTEGYDKEEYYQNIKANPIAREVKMADLLHNMSPERKIKPKDHEKINRMRREYYKNFIYLYKDYVDS